MKLSPYPSFNGNCEEAFQFYATHLGGKILNMFHYEGSPMAEHAPGELGKKVMHARIEVAGVVLMGSDSVHGDYEPVAGIQLSLDLTDVAEAERTFAALSENGKVTMPLQKTFWAAQFGMVTDRFGIPWIVNCESSESV